MIEPYTPQQFFDQKANITNGQLLAMNPKFSLTIAKQLRKPVVRIKDSKKNSIKKSDEVPDDKNTPEVGDLIQVANTARPNADQTSALYCKASIKHIKFLLIVDSESAGNIIYLSLLKDLNMEITKASKTVIIHDCIIPMDAIITDANSYAAIVRNNWLHKTKAILNYNNNLMTIEWKGQVLEVITECREMPHHIFSIEVPNMEAEDEAEEEDEDIIEESEEEFESDDEEAQEQLFCNAKFITQEKAQKIKEELKEGSFVNNEYYYQDKTIVGRQIDSSIQKSVDFTSHSSGKKNGKKRLCVNYQKLNNVTKKDHYLLSKVDDMLETLSGCQWLSLLDLASRFLQVELDQKDREKSTFITKFSTYKFTVMPFGLLQAGLKLSPEKCFFFKDEIPFLGHVVSHHSIQTDPEKLRVIREFPVPKDLTQLRDFITLASYYQKFVKNFSRIVEPLNRLLKKNTPFVWRNDQVDSFKYLKNCLMTPPILSYPNFKKPFILYTDASTFALGAILSQKNEDKKECVIAYASRTLGKHERTME
ncbi:retroviral-like aspartic protease 1 [Rhizophagus clarus]|uniref:Retroviral-like aspartic protease 1 n=1 Tax=Rhizophagus clarus TaxID=94130 RepID=A0A8H3R5A2_9GLOM|nr:retroviral-like aspartic protease 1 [Rhizophagus clarus]